MYHIETFGAIEETTRMPARRLRPNAAYRFAHAQAVRLGDLLGVISARDITLAGREIYTVRFDCADRPVRTVLGDHLSPDHAPAARDRYASGFPVTSRRSPQLQIPRAA